jgi:antitoxin HicB
LALRGGRGVALVSPDIRLAQARCQEFFGGFLSGVEVVSYQFLAVRKDKSKGLKRGGRGGFAVGAEECMSVRRSCMCIFFGTQPDHDCPQMKKQNKHVGSSLNEFLSEEGILEETRSIAIKEALAYQVQAVMTKNKITKVEMARRMKTSRAALDRLLDPGSDAVTLQTLSRAAAAIGRGLRIELV